MLKNITAMHNFGESDVRVAFTACGQSSAKTSNGNAFVPMGSSAILVHYQPAVLDSGHRVILYRIHISRTVSGAAGCGCGQVFHQYKQFRRLTHALHDSFRTLSKHRICLCLFQ